MKPTENIKRLIKNTKIKTNPAVNEAVLNDLLDKLDKSKNKHSAEKKPNVWRIIMKSKITKFAVAAVILITVLLGIKFTGTPDMANVAWADVIASIDKVKAVAYEQTIETRQGKSNSKCFVTEDGVMRTEIGTDFIMIFDFNEGITLTLDSYKDKKAFINHLIGGKKGRGLHKYINWLKNLSEEGGKYIGNEIIDGKEVSVFVHEIPYEKTTVWVNTKTLLPVRVEQLNLPNTDANIIMPTMFLSSSDFGDPNGNYSRGGSICSGRGSGKGINDETKKIMTNFNWNMEIDNSLFNTVPPADYIVEEKSINDSEVSEKDLIAALKFWTEMSDGFFPDNINDLGDPNKVKPMLIMKYKKGGDHKQEFEQAYDMMHIILKGVYFAQEKKADGNWEYTGGGAKFGDANMIICKWKLENSNSYRVLYGDLSIYDTNDMPQ